MDKTFRAYQEMLHAKLAQQGYDLFAELFPFRKLTAIDRDLRIVRARTGNDQFLVTSGCAPHTRNTAFKYEFIVHAEEPQKYFLDLINFAAYFHLTHADILPADVREIGTKFEARDYSHLYASVPYFLPRDINFIEIGTLTYCLTWLMPIRQFEAEYVAKHGTEAFENKLEHFGLNFFADRSDPSYLD